MYYPSRGSEDQDEILDIKKAKFASNILEEDVAHYWNHAFMRNFARREFAFGNFSKLSAKQTRVFNEMSTTTNYARSAVCEINKKFEQTALTIMTLRLT